MKNILDLLGDHGIFKDSIGNIYVSIEVDGTYYTTRLRSKELRDLLSIIVARKGLVSIKKTVNEIIEKLEAEAILATEVEEVNLRYSMRDGALYISLADRDYLVKISDEGIKRIRNRNIKFVYSKHRGKIAYKKEAKGNLERLWKYVPIRNKNSRLLFLVGLLNCCFPDTDYIIFLITGGSGCGKSFTTFCIRSIIDPSSFGIGSLLKSTKDIYLAATHNHLLTFDNNGHSLDSDVQNVLCQACTGGNYFERELYTNNEPLIIDLKNPVVINGLQPPITQDDTLNRTLHIRLQQLSPEDYAKTGGKKSWENQFNEDLPEIISGFYELLQQVLVLRDKVEIPAELPRMGDFAKIGIAVERILGYEKGAFLKAYKQNLNYGSYTIIEDSAVAQALIALAKDLAEAKIYTRQKLIETLKGYTNSSGGIPDSSRALKVELDRIEKALFELKGIQIRHIDRTRSGAKVEIIPPTKEK